MGTYRRTCALSDDSDVSGKGVPFYPGGNTPFVNKIKRGGVCRAYVIIRPIKTPPRPILSVPPVIPKRIRRRRAGSGRGRAGGTKIQSPVITINAFIVDSTAFALVKT